MFWYKCVNLQTKSINLDSKRYTLTVVQCRCILKKSLNFVHESKQRKVSKSIRNINKKKNFRPCTLYQDNYAIFCIHVYIECTLMVNHVEPIMYRNLNLFFLIKCRIHGYIACTFCILMRFI